IATGSAELVIFRGVLHHLSDEALAAALGEAARARTQEGSLLVLEPVQSNRLRARLLWSLDRGAHPRPADALKKALNQNFETKSWETYAIHHEYVLSRAVRKTSPRR